MPKKPQPKPFNCETCREAFYFKSDLICSLRVNKIKEGLPPASAICKNILECCFYKEKSKNII